MAKARLPGQISGEVIDMDFMAEYKHWLESGALSAEEHAELQSVADDKEEIESRFYAPLSFGTAGLRGVLGVGLNRMNRFTVGQAAQGLAKLIVSNGQAAMDRGVAIAYDSRHFSPEFAKQSACILAANGQGADLRRAAPDPGAVLCSPSLRLHRGHQHHRIP